VFLHPNGISLFFADPRHSTSNGQIETAHSSLKKSARCIKDELILINYSEIFIGAAQIYNLTIHSITNQRPFGILFTKIKYDQTSKLLQQAQEKMLNFHNNDRQDKNTHVGEVICEKKHGERNKLSSRYKKTSS